MKLMTSNATNGFFRRVERFDIDAIKKLKKRRPQRLKALLNLCSDWRS
jgi:hypothetical protein